MPSGMILSLLHDYLTGRGRDDPNTRKGLRSVHLRIGVLLGVDAVRRQRGTAPPRSDC